MTGTWPMLKWCVGSLAVARLLRPKPWPTLVMVLVPSCWTMWSVSAMKRGCPSASTWAGVSTTVAITRMRELCVHVRLDWPWSVTLSGVKSGTVRHLFITCAYAILHIHNFCIYNHTKLHHEPTVPLKTSTSYLSSHLWLCLHLLSCLVAMTVVLWGGDSPDSMKNKSLCIPKTHTDSTYLDGTSLIPGWFQVGYCSNQARSFQYWSVNWALLILLWHPISWEYPRDRIITVSSAFSSFL